VRRKNAALLPRNIIILTFLVLISVSNSNNDYNVWNALYGVFAEGVLLIISNFGPHARPAHAQMAFHPPCPFLHWKCT
jgi:hypothetical protein